MFDTGLIQVGLYLMVLVMLGFYIPSIAKVIQRRDLGLKTIKSHLEDWKSPGTNS